MKIDELIEKLQSLKETHGNIDVVFRDDIYGDGRGHHEVGHTSVVYPYNYENGYCTYDEDKSQPAYAIELS